MEPILKSIYEITLVDINKYNYENIGLPKIEEFSKNPVFFNKNKEKCDRMKLLYRLTKENVVGKYKNIKEYLTTFNITLKLGNIKYHLYFNNLIIERLILDNINKNKLILTSSLDELKILNKYNLDLVALYNKYENLDNFIKSIHNDISKRIIDSTTTEKFIKFIEDNINNNKKYNFIYINNIFFNYEWIIQPISLIVKLPSFLLIILNSLLILDENGSIYIQIIQGHVFNIPIFAKIFGLLSSLFKSYKINNYEKLFIRLEFHNFKGLAKHSIDSVYNLIDICKKNLKNVFSLDDIVSCIISNNFYYYLSDSNIDKINNIYKHHITKEILYDITNINLNYNDNYNGSNIVKELNTIENEYRLYWNHYMESVKINKNKAYGKFIQDTILNMFLILNKNNLTDNIIYKSIFNSEIIDFNNNIKLLLNQSINEILINDYTKGSKTKISNFISSKNIINAKKTKLTTKLTKKSKQYDSCFLDTLYTESKYITLIKNKITTKKILLYYNKYNYNNEINEIIKSNKSLFQSKILCFSSENIINKKYDNKFNNKFNNKNIILQTENLNTVDKILNFINNNIDINNYLKDTDEITLFYDINYSKICNYMEWVKKILLPLVILCILENKNNCRINVVVKINIISSELTNNECSIFPFITNVINIYNLLFNKVILNKPMNTNNDNLEFYIIAQNYIKKNKLIDITNIVNKCYNNSSPKILNYCKIIKNTNVNNKINTFLYNIIEWKNNLNIELYRYARCNNNFGKCIL